MDLSRVLCATGGALLAGGVVVASPGVASAAWPGTNGKIAFVTTRNQSETIDLVNPEAGGIGNGTTDPANTSELTGGFNSGQTQQGVDSEPFFSPDGKTVVFSSDRNGAFQIFTIPVSSTLNGDQSDVAVPISQPASGGDDYAPSFAPNGCTVVFNRGNQALYTVNACAADPAATAALLYAPPESLSQASTSDGTDSRAVFDPADPTKLVFVGGDNHIHLLSGIGGTLTDTDLSAITNPGTASDADPDWSPNGANIVFDSTRGGGTNHQIYVMTADGSAVGPLMPNNGKSDTQPVFSPDGTEVAFTEPGQSNDVADEGVMPVAMGPSGLLQGTGTVKDLTLVGTGIPGPVDDQPDWQPVAGVAPVLPETPYAVLLPGGALLIAGGVILRRRRRAAA